MLLMPLSPVSPDQTHNAAKFSFCPDVKDQAKSNIYQPTLFTPYEVLFSQSKSFSDGSWLAIINATSQLSLGSLVNIENQSSDKIAFISMFAIAINSELKVDEKLELLRNLIVELDEYVLNNLSGLLVEESELSHHIFDIVEFDTNDLNTRKNTAIKELKGLFETSNASMETRQSFIEGNKYTLSKAEGNSNNLLSMLFRELPEETWPLIFFYFKSDFGHIQTDQSLENVFKQVKKGHPFARIYHSENERIDLAKAELMKTFIHIKETNSIDEVIWKGIAELCAFTTDSVHSEKGTYKGFYQNSRFIDVAAKALMHIVDNKYMNEIEFDETLRLIYCAACKTNTLYYVIHHYSLIEPTDKFVSTMLRLRDLCFENNHENYRKLIDGYPHPDVAHHETKETEAERSRRNALLETPTKVVSPKKLMYYTYV